MENCIPMNVPLVSIIVPVYNVEEYLRKCLDSIINQTLKDIEIICVNDGTKDNSVVILNEYAEKDSRVKIIHKNNGGLSSARNEGMKHASADFIGFVDSDDWIEPDTYELAYKAMTKNDADLVCWYTKIEPEADLLDNAIMAGIKEYHKINNSGFYNISDDVLMNCTVTVWNKLFKLSIIKQYEIVFPVGVLYEDTEFFMKYVMACKTVFFIDRYLTHYLQRANSIMWKNSFGKKRLSVDRIKIMKSIYSFYAQYNKISEYRKTISRIMIYDCFFNECNNNTKLNQLNIFRYTARFMQKVDLTLLDDSNNILHDLKQRRYFRLFRFFNKSLSLKKVIKKVIGLLFPKLSRKIYHRTNHYKVKVLHDKYEETVHRLEELDRKYEESRIRHEETNRKYDETTRRLEETRDALNETKAKLRRKSAILNCLIEDHVDLTLARIKQENGDGVVKSNTAITVPEATVEILNSFDKTSVIEELKTLDKFLFCPNNGNIGDVIIAEAEYQLFNSLGLQYEIFDLYDKDKGPDEQYVDYVYGGGGLFNDLYDYSNVLDTFKIPRFRKIIILPSSFNRCDDLLETFDKRFTVFCREEQSYEYCRSMNNSAQFILSHDIAFYLNFDLCLINKDCIQNSIGGFNKGDLDFLYESWCNYRTIVNNIKKSVNERVVFLSGNQKIGILLRSDKESAVKNNERLILKEKNLDLSSGWFSCTDAGFNKVLSLLFVSAINYFDVVVTDRLHIGIVSTLLGKNVYLLDNSYGKISGVYKQSLVYFSNVKFVDDISKIDGVSFAGIHEEKAGDFNFEMTFAEFLSAYFSTHNSDGVVRRTFLNEVVDG